MNFNSSASTTSATLPSSSFEVSVLFPSCQFVNFCVVLQWYEVRRRLEATTSPASLTSFAAQSCLSLHHQVICGGLWAFKTSPGLRVLNLPGCYAVAKVLCSKGGEKVTTTIRWSRSLHCHIVNKTLAPRLLSSCRHGCDVLKIFWQV